VRIAPNELDTPKMNFLKVGKTYCPSLFPKGCLMTTQWLFRQDYYPPIHQTSRTAKGEIFKAEGEVFRLLMQNKKGLIDVFKKNRLDIAPLMASIYVTAEVWARLNF